MGKKNQNCALIWLYYHDVWHATLTSIKKILEHMKKKNLRTYEDRNIFQEAQAPFSRLSLKSLHQYEWNFKVQVAHEDNESQNVSYCSWIFDRIAVIRAVVFRYRLQYKGSFYWEAECMSKILWISDRTLDLSDCSLFDICWNITTGNVAEFQVFTWSIFSSQTDSVLHEKDDSAQIKRVSTKTVRREMFQVKGLDL